MKKKSLRPKIIITAFLCFGALTGLAWAAVHFHPALLANWVGQALLAGPPLAGLFFLALSWSWGRTVQPAAFPTEDAGKAARGKSLRPKIIITAFLCFGALTGLAWAAVHFHPALLANWIEGSSRPPFPLSVHFHPALLADWIGPALLAGPPLVGLFFLAVSWSWGRTVQPAAFPTEDTKEKIGPADKIPGEEKTAPAAPPVPREMKTHPAERPPAVPEPEPGPPEPEVVVVQILGLLQREGRLLDFLQEDIEGYEDAQIGAAVRDVHRGCRAALKEALGLAPVLAAAEGSEVEVEEDFDVGKIKLVGRVHGKPPFKGVLRHGGWRFTELHLPEWTGREKTNVLAPAEIEIQ